MIDFVILDTDAFSFIYRGARSAPAFNAAIADRTPALTFVSVGELQFGALQRKWGPKRLADLIEHIGRCVIIPYDDEVPRVWADLRVWARRVGHPLHKRENTNDLWIAACAIRYGAPLLTGNRHDFEGVRDLDSLIIDVS